MPAIDMWLRQPAAQALGWALLQFVWQGAAVGVLTALALLALRRSASDVRYVVSSIGLALMLTLPIVTGVQKYQAINAHPDWQAPVVSKSDAEGSRLQAGDSRPAGAPGPAIERSARIVTSAPTTWLRALRAEALLPAVMLIWIAGVSFLSVRLFTGWLWAQRLRTRGVSAADDACRRMASRLARRLRIRRAVTLLESSLVEVPTVIGFLKPVVLLPATALSGLTAQQLEAILAHELAHIRRHDYVVNLLQTLVETVLFYHPAVWWLSRRIRIERENCCDDLAVSLCGDPVAYATALADLEALRSSGPVPERHIAMAATGGSLLLRVRRLLGARSSHSGRGPAWLAATAAITLVGCVAYSAEDHRPARDRRPVHVVEIDKRAVHELSRAIRYHVRAARTDIRQAADTVRRAVRSTVRPAVAAARSAVVQAVPVVAEAEPVATVAGPMVAEAAPGMPVAVVAPAAVHVAEAQSQSTSQRSSDSNGNWSWSNNGEKLEVSYHGAFEFTDDDTDVRQLSSGGWLKISDGKWLGRHSVEIRERDGQLEHQYFVNGSARPYEPEGRLWLRQNLPRFVRNTGIAAPSRVARFLKSGGPAAALTEIGRVDSTYVKGIYYRELFKQATLTGEQYRQVMTQAAREMRSSNYELAQLLIAVSERLPADEASLAAYFDAARAITSDYELRRVYSTMLKRGPVSSQILGGILANSKSISSDYELAELLRQVLAQQPLDDRNRAAFFSAVATIDGAYERRRVLSAVVSGQRPSEPALLESALSVAASNRSNYETSQFLQDVLRQNGVEGSVRAPFFAAVNSIDSNYERGRVLQTVVRRSDVSADTLRAVLQSAKGMDGYELSQLLQVTARNHSLTGDVRETYLSAADRLSDYEQGQALAALVRSERRK
jgi:beta-lactamase regulating signal transducer with metallopeptidase domain